MGGEISKMNFEDIVQIINNKMPYTIISTLPIDSQSCLIYGTLSINAEESMFNDLIEKRTFDKDIIIYGRNHSDITVTQKYKYLKSIGFYNIHIYAGGIFEWLILQDIYGEEIIKTTSKCIDFLNFKPDKRL